jgi:hypothetical protein
MKTIILTEGQSATFPLGEVTTKVDDTTIVDATPEQPIRKMESFFDTGTGGNLYEEFLDVLITGGVPSQLAEGVWMYITQVVPDMNGRRAVIAEAFMLSEDDQDLAVRWSQILENAGVTMVHYEPLPEQTETIEPTQSFAVDPCI